MNKLIVAVIAALLAVASVFSAPAFGASAVAGTVVTVAPGQPTQEQQYQQPYNNGYGYNSYNSYSQDHRSAAIGSVVGGLVGILAARHSRAGWYWGAGGGAAAGYAVGSIIDHNRQVRQVRYAQSMPSGVQIIVKIDGGQTIAIFSHVANVYAGERVWVVGGQQVVPIAQ